MFSLRTMTKKQTWRLICGLALVACTERSSPVQAQQSEDRTWRLSQDAGKVGLAFGSDSAEDMPVVFTCKASSGSVSVFVAETDAALKPNQKVTAIFAAGETRAKVPGKTGSNEDAGVPSFDGTLPATDPLFAALATADDLSIDVGPAHQDVPLQLIGEQGAEFAGLCRKGKPK
jgi:hypothetical protein